MSRNRTSPLIFDVETGPRPEVIADPGVWVKADSRLTDPKKIAADLADKAAAGALSPVTGEVLAIGYSQDGEDWCEIRSADTSEAKLLERVMQRFHDCICQGAMVIGFNVLDFDIPFIAFRARINKVKVPPAVGGFYRSRFQPSELFCDLMVRAQFGRYDRGGYSLDRLCKAFGIQGKNGDGAFFSDLLKSDPEKAKAYLLNDIRATRELAEVLL